VVIAVAGAVAFGLTRRPDTALRVATGLVSHTLCSDTFVIGLDPAQVAAETFPGMPGVHRLLPLLRHHVDLTRREVSASVAGLFGSRAIYRDGMGCTLLYPGDADAVAAPAPALARAESPPRLDEIAGPGVVEPADERLRRALDRAFADSASGPTQGSKAVVVVHADRIVAERYAPGFGIDTPLLGWSMTKSVMNALVGILVRQGRLSVSGPAPVPVWHHPSDPRRAITIEQLLRMTSGLALDDTNNGFDPSSRMLYTEPDMAAYAARFALIASPGARYHYSNLNTLILSRIVRDAVGGRAEDVVRFADRELFAPLGMRRVTLEFDAADTPVGSTYLYATARDWARFGLLYANDGVVGGARILPEGWVDFSATWTPGSRDGYGAGFYTNRGDSEGGRFRVRGGMPSDSFFASGTQGQRLVIAPSARLVVVRLGRTPDWDAFDKRAMVRLVADATAALNP
jgi:CubicO group peptidase (beta-lactamase class C family)